MAIFEYSLVRPITASQHVMLEHDIRNANLESRKMWRKTHNAFNRRVIRYSIGWMDFTKFIATNAELFSGIDIIKGFRHDKKKVYVEIDDSFIGMLDTGSSLGLAHVTKAINFISQKTGGELKPELYNREGFSEYIKKALTDNGVELV